MAAATTLPPKTSPQLRFPQVRSVCRPAWGWWRGGCAVRVAVVDFGVRLEVKALPYRQDQGRELHGATLEDLLEAADSASDPRAGEYMFHWTRPVTALSPGDTAAGLEPAS